MDPHVDRVAPAGLDEGVEISGMEADELPHLVVPDPLLEDEPPDEGDAHAKMPGRAGDVQPRPSLACR